MDMKDCDALANVPYFKNLKPEIVCSILEYSSLKNLSRGEYLFLSEDICNHIYIIKIGLVEIFQTGEEGNKIIMHHAGTGALLGDTILFNKEKFGANACAVEVSEILSIEKAGFEKLIYAYPEIGIRMLSDFGKRIKKLKNFTAEIALNDVRKRIIRLLLELVRERGEDSKNSMLIDNVPTQDDMAYRIGTVREVLCRELHKLENEELVQVKRGVIIVNDIKRLKDMISFEEGESIFPIFLPMKDYKI